MAFTISTSNDDRGRNGTQKRNEKHNRREEQTVTSANARDLAAGREPHIKTELTHTNICLVDMDLREAYEHILGEAITQYNSNKKPCRQTSVEKEMAKIESSKKQELGYEMIVQVGNRDCHPDDEICKRILTEYYQSFVVKFPNLFVYQAHIHCDELGGIHLHLDYIPVHHMSKKGLETQIGLTKAFEEMGYDNPTVEIEIDGEMKEVLDKEAGAKGQWIKDANSLLESICVERYGLEIEHPHRERKHLDTDEYKEMMEEVDRLKSEVSSLKKEAVAEQRKIVQLSNENANLQSQLERTQEQIEVAVEEIRTEVEQLSIQRQEINNSFANDVVEAISGYGITAYSLGHDENIDRTDAEEYLHSYTHKTKKKIATAIEETNKKDANLVDAITSKIDTVLMHLSLPSLEEQKKKSNARMIADVAIDMGEFDDVTVFLTVDGYLTEKSEKMLEMQIERVLEQHPEYQNLDNESKQFAIDRVRDDLVAEAKHEAGLNKQSFYSFKAEMFVLKCVQILVEVVRMITR